MSATVSCNILFVLTQSSKFYRGSNAVDYQCITLQFVLLFAGKLMIFGMRQIVSRYAVEVNVVKVLTSFNLRLPLVRS